MPSRKDWEPRSGQWRFLQSSWENAKSAGLSSLAPSDAALAPVKLARHRVFTVCARGPGPLDAILHPVVLTLLRAPASDAKVDKWAPTLEAAITAVEPPATE